MLKRTNHVFFFFCLSIIFFPWILKGQEEGPGISGFQIIPKPVNIVAGTGSFDFSKITNIYFSKPPALDPSEDFSNWLKTYFNIKLKRSTQNVTALEFIHSDTIQHENAYHLLISPNGIKILYKDEAAAFYATQTLKQLFPIENKDVSLNKNVRLPVGEVYDFPRFTYRGMHLDESRHFFGMEAVKKYIDMLAFQKMNYFHWHLTDDQGWRIEIKNYPRLTEVASCREETRIGHYSDRPIKYDGKKYCYYYTQDQIREIVKYAAAKYITIIPEIEMPGHATAALAAYPEFGCTDQKVTASTTWGVFEDIFCPKEATFLFLNNVLDEVMDLFPSKMIHIGGDEVPKKQWKQNALCQELIRKHGLKDEHGLQSYFIRRIEEHINSKGRIMIGWDEILEGGLAPNAVVMSWRGVDGGIAAATQDHNVIMSPGSHCYFDQYQVKGGVEPVAIGGYLPLKKVYTFDPVPAKLPQDKWKFILGGQANLWAEYIATPQHLQYMAYPRSFALSEALWSPLGKRDYPDFLTRLSFQINRLDTWDINYARHFYSLDIISVFNKIEIKTDATSPIQYRISEGKKTTAWLAYNGPIEIENSGTIEARLIEKNGEKVYASSRKEYIKHLGAGKLDLLTYAPNEKYNAGGVTALMNGLFGPNDNYGGDEWLGFLGKDIEAVFDLESSKAVNNVEMRFYNAPGQWIYGPKSIEVFGGNTKDQWTKIEKSAELTENDKIIKAKIHLNKGSYRFIKVVVNRHGIIADGAQGAGNEAWLFCDEIVIH